MSNLAKEWQEGNYSVRVSGKTVTVSTMRFDKGSYLGDREIIATAKCAPEDEFNLSTGVALAMDRLNKELSKGKIEVGDKVKIVNSGLSYTTYAGWIKKNINDVGLAACYSFGQIPKEDDTVYIVKAIAPWDNNVDEKLAYVQRYFIFSNGESNDNEFCYLMSIDGLEKV